MGEPGGHYAKQNNPVTIRQILYGSIYVRHVESFQTHRSTIVVAHGFGEGEVGIYCLRRTEFQWGKMEKFWRCFHSIVNVLDPDMDFVPDQT